jgi:uncharacterized protein (DUF1800 family)
MNHLEARVLQRNLKIRSLQPHLIACMLLIAALSLSGCATGLAPGFASYIASPTNTLRVNQTVQLANNAAFTGSPMVYSVNGVVGGNDKLGTVDSNGVYTAPAIVPVPSNTVVITAQATNYPKDTPGSVTLNVWNPIPIIGSATPANFAEGTQLVTVTGSQFVYGSQIFWNGVAVPTTYVSSTELAATLAAPTPGNYGIHVTNPDPGSAQSYDLSELVKPGQVTLAVQTNETTVRVTNSLYLGVSVNGTSNTGLTWKINGMAQGNAVIGTIAPGQSGGVMYTAPAVVPTPNNIVQLTATSVDDPTVSISQNISVFNPVPILNSATPMAFDPGPAKVVLQGSAFITGATVLANGVPVPTTFNSGNQLTASLNLTDPGNLDLQVLNPSPGPATSTDLIAQINGTPSTLAVSSTDASRFLEQATFGATDGDIHHLSKVGYLEWFSEQFLTQPTLHMTDVEEKLMINNPACAANDVTCNAALFTQNGNGQNYVAESFYQQAMAGNDQLRQRVKYSLSEMFVISSTNGAVGNMPRGTADYYDMLGRDAFGNFRQLLEDVTLHPMMGEFLSMQGNDKGDANRDPDENYAREVMQLLTIGLYQLNPDGTQKLDATGNTIPTYSNVDVMGLAKVFTGWSWNVPGDSSDKAWSNCCYYVGPGFGEDILPMQPFPGHHSTDSKSFLGVSIAASSNPDPVGDLKIALDTLFNHPNLPPFFAKQMIQHLVTSNPSPAYVGRVAAVFIDNGQGVRGDMKAVIQAILLDDEARNATTAADNVGYGKVREPMLKYIEWARAFTAQSRDGVYNMGDVEDPVYGIGQMTLRSPSVFNWFAPGFSPPGTSIVNAGLVAPEMEITNVSTVVGYMNFMQSAISADAHNGVDVYSSYSTEVGLAATPDALMDRLNLLLMAGQMDGSLRSKIIGAISSIDIPSGDQEAIDAALLNRVKLAVYLTMASPAFNAQF